MMNIVTAFQQIAAHFTGASHQKTAEDICQIETSPNEIIVEDWNWAKGFFVVSIGKAGWPGSIKAYEKNFLPWEIEEYCRANFEITYFQEWWQSLLTGSQQIIVSDFVRVHNGTLQNELDVYYNQQTGRVWKS